MGVLTRYLDPATWAQVFMPSRGMEMYGYTASDRGPDAPFWYQSVMGMPNPIGIVGGENAWMFVSSSCAAMRILCGVGANMPLERKRLEMKNGRATANVMSRDPVHLLLNHKPNPLMTAKVFRSQMIGWQIGHGTAFAEIQREIDGQKPYRLWPIHPCRMTPFINEDDDSLWWSVRNKDAEPTKLPDTNVLRIPYTLIDDDGIHGLGVGKMAARSIGLGQTLERTETESSSSSLPRIVVETPKRMGQPEQDAFRHQWSQWISGGENVPVLLVDDAKAHVLNWSAVDSDTRNRREFNKLDLASWFGVPPALLDGTEDLGLLFQKISLHYLEFWEPECEEKLLNQSERDEGQTWQNDYKSLLRADPVARSTYYTNRAALGSITPNEVRMAEGENPSETENADVEHIQGAMRKLSDPYKPGAENPQGNPKDGKSPPLTPMKPPKAAKAIRAARAAVKTMLRETLSRMTAKEMKRAKCDASQPKTFIPKLEEFYAEHRKYLAEALSGVCQAASAVGLKLSAERVAAEWCETSLASLLEASGCSVGELPNAVATCVSDWNSARVQDFVSSVKTRQRKAVKC